MGGVLFGVWLASQIYYYPGYSYSKGSYSSGYYSYGGMGPIAGFVSGLLILAFLIRLHCASGTRAATRPARTCP